MVAKTFQGLEDVLRDELIALGAQNVEIGTRMVSFEGDKALMYKANLCCRTALRILVPIVKFTAEDTDQLYDFVRDFDWDQYLTPDSTFAIDSTVNSHEFTHSRFVTYRVKDGIVDHFNDKYGRRPSIRLNSPDLILNVHIADTRVTISLDSSGEPLSKRGYRAEQTEAPVNEVLAAGIILKTGWRGDSNFVDPMCGSGTFLIEAALIAANINPGIYREGFAFERWKDFDPELFNEIYNDDSAEKEFSHKIYGGDIDPEAVLITRKNLERAHVEEMVDVRCLPFEEWTDVPEPGILVTNPPYGERLKPESMENLYRGIGKELKQHFKGWHAWILGYRDEHFAAIGLRPSVKFPILNGSLECSLREYVLFDGTYADFKTGGGSVKNEDFNRDFKPRTRHVSDDEWESETRRFRSERKNRDSRSERGSRDERRDFRRDSRRDDRKRDDRRRDSFRKEGEGRRDFRRDDRDDRRRDSFRKEGPKDRAPKKPKRDDYKQVTAKAPRLPESSTVFKTESKMRSRKRRNTDDQ